MIGLTITKRMVSATPAFKNSPTALGSMKPLFQYEVRKSAKQENINILNILFIQLL
jgi:hypothetical protein